MGRKTTVAVAEALQVVVVEGNKSLGLAIQLFGILRAVDDVFVFIPVNNLGLGLGLLVALHNFDVVHPDFEILGAALVDRETDFSNLIPVDTSREFRLAGVVPVETTVREVHQRNGNFLPVRSDGAALDVLVHGEHDLSLLAIAHFVIQEANLHRFATLLALDHKLDLGVQHVLVQIKELVIQADRGTRILAGVQLDIQGRLRLVTTIFGNGNALA